MALTKDRLNGSLTGRALVLLLTIGFVGVILAVPVRNYFGQRAEIAALEAQIQVTQENVDRLKLEQQRWADPAYIAAEARRRLLFVLPGETGYVSLGADGRPAAETISEQVAETEPNWYGKLWGALAEADDSVEPGSVDKVGRAGSVEID